MEGVEHSITTRSGASLATASANSAMDISSITPSRNPTSKPASSNTATV